MTLPLLSTFGKCTPPRSPLLFLRDVPAGKVLFFSSWVGLAGDSFAVFFSHSPRVVV